MNATKKTVVITGANDGIGLALTQKFLNEGYFVIGTSRSGKIEAITSDNLFVVTLDVTDTKSVEAANKSIRNNFTSIDVLINNAGIAPDLDTIVPNLDSLKQTFDTNVFGLLAFTESILDVINDHGSIANISSDMAVLSKEIKNDSTAYRMSKAALNMYTKTLAGRLLANNITVFSIHPGWVQTKLSTVGAPLTPEFSANGIFNLVKNTKETGTFWSAEQQTKMPW